MVSNLFTDESNRMFITMMENYERVTHLTNAGLESQGELARANEVRVNSLAGQISILTDKCLALMDGLEPLVYGVVGFGNAILDLVNSLGVIPSIIGVATASFLTFNQTGNAVRDSLLRIGEAYSPLMSSMGKFNSALDEEKLKLEQLIQKAEIKIASTKADIVAKQRLGESTNSLNKKLTMQQTVLKGAQIELAKTTIKTVALQTVMSMGLSLAITAVVSGIGLLVNKLRDSSSQMEATKESAKKLSDSLSEINNISVDVKRFKQLNEILKDETLESEKRLQYEQELESIRATLSSNEDFKSILQNESLEYEKQYNYMKGILDLRSRENIKESLGDLEDNDKTLEKKAASFSIVVQQLETSIARLEQKETDLKQAETEFANATDDNTRQIIQEKIEQIKQDMIAIQDTIDQAESKALDIKDYAENHNSVIDAAKEASVYTDVTRVNLEEGSLSFLNNFISAKAESEELANNVNSAADGMSDSFSQTPKDIRSTTEEYLDLCDSLKSAKELLQDINKNGMNLDNAKELFDTFEDFKGNINNAADAQDFLNDKIAEMEKKTDEAYTNMMKLDENFWNNKMKNSQEWLNHESLVQQQATQLGAEMLGIQSQDFANYINEKGGFREIDYSNATNAAEAEGVLNSSLLTQMLQWYSMYVNEKGGARTTDMSNIVEFLNKQGVAEAQTIEQLVEMWNSYYKAKKAEIQASLNTLSNSISAGNPYDDRGNLTPEQSKQLANLNKQMAALENASKTMGNYFNAVDKTFNQVTTSLSGSGIGGKLDTSPSISSGGSSGGSSSTEKEVEDLELLIDRYYKFNDAIDDLNNKLALNKALQNNAKDYNTRKKLMEEEIKLMNEKVDALEKLQKEQNNDMLDNKNILSSNGFTFDNEGNIKNYASQLKKLQDQANKLSGDAKKAAIEHVNYIVSTIEAYTDLTNNTLPNTEVAIEELKCEIEKLNKEHQEQLKKIEKLGNRYFDLEQAIRKVDNALDLNKAKQENATGAERVKLMEEEIALLKEKQKLVTNQKVETQKEAKELKDDLSSKGVKFNEDGTISNYKQVIENMKASANLLAGEYRDEAIEEIEKLIELMEEYSTLVEETIPELEIEWEEYTSSIKEAEKEKAELVTSVEKDITSAIEHELQKRTESVKSELQKQKDAYNKQFEEEDWEDSLSAEQRKLDEIQQAINNMSRDTSLAGQLKLQQLREEYEAQQKVIDDMIREHEKEKGNERFDEEMEKLDEELEEALSPENISAMVNKALVDGFVTIGDEVIELNTLMTDWLDETGDGLTSMGNILKEELLGNLESAKALMSEMGIIRTSVGKGQFEMSSQISPVLGEVLFNDLTSKFNTFKGNSDVSNQIVQIDSLMKIDGNVTEDVLPEVQRLIENAKDELIDNIASELLKR